MLKSTKEIMFKQPPQAGSATLEPPQKAKTGPTLSDHSQQDGDSHRNKGKTFQEVNLKHNKVKRTTKDVFEYQYKPPTQSGAASGFNSMPQKKDSAGKPPKSGVRGRERQFNDILQWNLQQSHDHFKIKDKPEESLIETLRAVDKLDDRLKSGGTIVDLKIQGGYSGSGTIQNYHSKTKKAKKIVGRVIQEKHLVVQDADREQGFSAMQFEQLAHKQSLSPTSRKQIELGHKKVASKQRNQGQLRTRSSKSMEQAKGAFGQKSRPQSNLIRKRSQPKKGHLIEFLDASLLPHEGQPSQTLNILTQTADNLISSGVNQTSKSHGAKRAQSQGRDRIQMKYLNFQRDVAAKKRGQSALETAAVKKTTKLQTLKRKVPASHARQDRSNKIKRSQSQNQYSSNLHATNQTLNSSDVSPERGERGSNGSRGGSSISSNQKRYMMNPKLMGGAYSAAVDGGTSSISVGSMNVNRDRHRVTAGNLLDSKEQFSEPPLDPHFFNGPPKYSQVNRTAGPSALENSQDIIQGGFERVVHKNGRQTSQDVNNNKLSVQQFKQANVLNNSAGRLRESIQRSPVRNNPKQEKVDRIIRENLKKLKEEKQLQRLEREKLELKIKQKKQELKKANDRVRKQNNERVLKRQQILKSQKENIGEIGLSQSKLQQLEKNLKNFLQSPSEKDINATILQDVMLDIREGSEQKHDFNKLVSFNSKGKKGISKSKKIKDYTPLTQKFELNFNKKLNLSKQDEQDGPDYIPDAFVMKPGKKLKDVGRKSYGLDFIDVRKEITAELKLKAHQFIKKKPSSKINGALKEELRMARVSGDVSGIDPADNILHRLDASEKIYANLRTSKSHRYMKEDPVAEKSTDIFNKEKIRKFMKAKQKEHKKEIRKTNIQEIKRARKVQINLAKLQSFTKKRPGVLKDPSGTINMTTRVRSGLSNPVNIRAEAGRVRRNQTVVHDDDAFGHGGASTLTPNRMPFEVSENSLTISGGRQPSRVMKGQTQKVPKDLYEDSKMGTLEDVPELHHRPPTSKRILKSAKEPLAACFEISHSSKSLRAQLRDTKPSNSPKDRKRTLNQSTLSGRSGSRPTSSLNKKHKKVVTSKRSKSGRDRYLPAGGRIVVKVPDNQNMTTIGQTIANTMDTVEDGLVSGMLTLDLKLSQEGAATIIQKEVRKYLKCLGFYEARPQGSPERDTQINVFIDRSNRTSRKSSEKKSSSKHGRRQKKTPKQSSPPHLTISDDSNVGKDESVAPPANKQRITFIERRSVGDHTSPDAKPQAASIRSSASVTPTTSQREPLEHPPKQRSITPTPQDQERDKEQQLKIMQLFSGQPPIGQKSVDNEYSQKVQTPTSQKRLSDRPAGPQLEASSSQDHSSSEIDIHLNQLSVESKRSSNNMFTNEGSQSQSSNSLFDRNAFQNFTQKKLQNISKNNEYQKLIQFREDCLIYRERRERRTIKKMLRQNQFSPRTYQAKKESIDRWVSVERHEIEQTKSSFKEEWDKTVQMIEDTQKNVVEMRSKMNLGQSNNNFNSQSCNSLISSKSNRPAGLNLPVPNQEHAKSILIEDPPKSYRSGRQEAPSVPILRMDVLSSKEREAELENGTNSMGVISSRRSGNGFEKNASENLLSYMERRMGQVGGSHQKDAMSDFKKRGSESELSVKHQASLTGEKDRSVKPRLSGSDLDSDEISGLEHQPSAEFLERLEKNMEGADMNNVGITIEENAFDEPEIENNLNIGMGEYKDPMIIKDFSVSDKSEGESRPIDKSPEVEVQIPPQETSVEGQLTPSYEHLQEPSIVASGGTKPGDNIKISEMLRQQNMQNILNQGDQTDSSENFLQEPAIISSSSPKGLIPAVIKPTAKQFNVDNESDRLQLIEKVTDELFYRLLAEACELPQRQQDKKKDQQQKDKAAADQDIYLIDAASEKEERKEWIEIRQRHLIENDLIRADTYINEIVEALLQFEIDSDEEVYKDNSEQDNFHIQFLKKLTKPIKREPSDVLSTLQTAEIGSYYHFETAVDMGRHPIVPVDLYLEIEKAREELLMARKQQMVGSDVTTLWESIHIQNKCFFDAINESLTKFRPYGITGEPMPWSNKVRRLQTQVDIASVDTERLFMMVRQEVFRWAQTFCGCLPTPVFTFPVSHHPESREEFNDELFNEIREKKLTTVLSQETVEQEHHWLNYEYEEAQVKVDLSDMILEHLVDELVGFLNGKQQRAVEKELDLDLEVLGEPKTEEVTELLQPSAEVPARLDSFFGQGENVDSPFIIRSGLAQSPAGEVQKGAPKSQTVENESSSKKFKQEQSMAL